MIEEFTNVNNKNSGVKNTAGLNLFIEFEELRTYITNLAGELVYDVTKIPQGYTAKEWFDLVSKSDAMAMTEAELSVKYSFLKVASQSDMDAFRAYEYYVSKGALPENIVNNGIMSEVELKSKYIFLTDCQNADLNAYRGYEYLKSTKAGDDLIRETGILPDSDLKAKHDFLSDCTDKVILDEFRNYEYAKVNVIESDVITEIGEKTIFLDENGKIVALGEVTSVEVASKSVYSITMGDVTIGKYLSASGKTADQLNHIDLALMKLADGITGGTDDFANDLAKFANRYKGL